MSFKLATCCFGAGKVKETEHLFKFSSPKDREISCRVNYVGKSKRPESTVGLHQGHVSGGKQYFFNCFEICGILKYIKNLNFSLFMVSLIYSSRF